MFPDVTVPSASGAKTALPRESEAVLEGDSTLF
jgi:hypothetical protein